MSNSNGDGPAADPSDDDADEPLGLGLRVASAIGVISTLALFGFLIVFSFVGGETRNPDELDQIGFAPVAEEICADHQRRLAALPSASATATPDARADVLDEANRVLADMIAALRGEVDRRTVVADLPDLHGDLSEEEQAVVEAGDLSEKDAGNLARWLADYDVFWDDRVAHSGRLREEGDVRFLVTDKEGNQISEWVDGYARVNDMESCQVPLDL